MKSSVFEKQAEEELAELVMGSENSAGVHCPDNIRELLLSAYKAGGYQYAKMLEVERVGRIEYLTHRFGNDTAGRWRRFARSSPKWWRHTRMPQRVRTSMISLMRWQILLLCYSTSQEYSAYRRAIWLIWRWKM